MKIDLKGKPNDMAQTIKAESMNQSNLPYLYSRLNGLFNMGFSQEEMTKLDNLHNTQDDTDRKKAKEMAIDIVMNQDIAEDVDYEEVEDEC